MHVHILGICGTFMGGIAAIAKAAGHRVTGSDKNVYPPMSTQLEALAIEHFTARGPQRLRPLTDALLVGPRLTRGEALAIARADLDYVERLLGAPDRSAGLAVALPRAADVPGMAEHHRENCDAVFGPGDAAR